MLEGGRGIDTVCKIVAICLHFLVLAAFSWMSIMTFDGYFNYSTSPYFSNLGKFSDF